MSSKPKGYIPNLKVTSAWGLGFGIIILIIIGVLLSGMPQDWRVDEGILGTSAPLMSDLSVLAYILLLIPMMLAGFVFARNKQFVPHHQVVMTAIVILNWGLISFVMAASLRDTLKYETTDNTAYRFLPLIHAAFGLTAQVIGTYLVARMWFEDELPAWAKIKKIKPLMRTTLACWLIAAALGVTTYVTWYDPFSDNAADDVTPASTPEATQEAESTAEPAATEDVAATAEPVATEDVAATAEPIATEAVVVTAEPVETEDIVVTEAAEPVETEDVEETQEPVETEEPAETEEVEYNDLGNYGNSDPVATESIEIVETEPVETEEAIPTATPTIIPTNTPRPSRTPTFTPTNSGPTLPATNTPRPTNTQRPTRVPTSSN